MCVDGFERRAVSAAHDRADVEHAVLGQARVPREDRVALTEGVTGGERLVIEGQIKLQPNAPVKIEPGAAMQPLALRPNE